MPECSIWIALKYAHPLETHSRRDNRENKTFFLYPSQEFLSQMFGLAHFKYRLNYAFSNFYLAILFQVDVSKFIFFFQIPKSSLFYIFGQNMLFWKPTVNFTEGLSFKDRRSIIDPVDPITVRILNIDRVLKNNFVAKILL